MNQKTEQIFCKSFLYSLMKKEGRMFRPRKKVRTLEDFMVDYPQRVKKTLEVAKQGGFEPEMRRFLDRECKNLRKALKRDRKEAIRIAQGLDDVMRNPFKLASKEFLVPSVIPRGGQVPVVSGGGQVPVVSGGGQVPVNGRALSVNGVAPAKKGLFGKALGAAKGPFGFLINALMLQAIMNPLLGRFSPFAWVAPVEEEKPAGEFTIPPWLLPALGIAGGGGLLLHTLMGGGKEEESPLRGLDDREAAWLAQMLRR